MEEMLRRVPSEQKAGARLRNPPFSIYCPAPKGRKTDTEYSYFYIVKKRIPFDFILDLLSPLSLSERTPSERRGDGGEALTVKPMFGCHAIYSGEKIMLIVRKKEDHTDANGVWIATGKEHHASLKKELPSMQSVYILSDGKGETGPEGIETNWQMIHQDADDFEESVTKICEMILKGDERIGKLRPLPKGRKNKKYS